MRMTTVMISQKSCSKRKERKQGLQSVEKLSEISIKKKISPHLVILRMQKLLAKLDPDLTLLSCSMLFPKKNTRSSSMHSKMSKRVLVKL